MWLLVDPKPKMTANIVDDDEKEEIKVQSTTNRNNDKKTVEKDENSHVANHYNDHNTKKSYEGWWYKDKTPFQYFLAKCFQQILELDNDKHNTKQPNECILDIGCGTGNFSAFLGEQCGLKIYGIDPYFDSFDLQNANYFEFLGKYGALNFVDKLSKHKSFFNKIYLKEVIHHIDDSVVQFATNIRQYFEKKKLDKNQQCSLVVMTRKSNCDHYPFFKKAKENWSKCGQRSADEYIIDLKQAGFKNVECIEKEYKIEISIKIWKNMIRNRFWSIFSPLTEQEIEDGFEELNWSEWLKSKGNDNGKKYDDDSVIVFYDKLNFLRASL